MNKLKTALNLLLLLISTFLLHTPAYTQGQSKVWIVQEPDRGSNREFFKIYNDANSFDTNKFCVMYEESFKSYPVDDNDKGFTLENFISRENLQNSQKIVCSFKGELHKALKDSVPEMKGKSIAILSDVSDCKEIDDELNNTAVTFENKNVYFYCKKNAEGIGKINLCETGGNSCNNLESIKNTECNLDLNDSVSCDFLKCLNKSTNSKPFTDIDFTGGSQGTRRERTLFCAPTQGYTSSEKIVCSNKVTVGTTEQVVTYNMAYESMYTPSSSLKGVCKFQSDYSKDKNLIDKINQIGPSNSCSLSNDLSTEISKTDKSGCDNPSLCQANNTFSAGEGENIFCVQEGSDPTKGKKYICKSSYYKRNQGALPCVGGNRLTQISDYTSAIEAIERSNSGNYCDSEIPCKGVDNYVEEIKLERTISRLLPLGYTGILQRLSQLLYATAVFLFVLLMIINGIHLVRSGNSPEELKKAKEGIFKTIAGFLFVVFSGGFIISIINSMQQMSP